MQMIAKIFKNLIRGIIYMKKLLGLLLMIVMVLSLVACGGEKQKPVSQGESNQKTSKELDQTKDPASEDTDLQPEEGAELLVWESEGPELEWLKEIAEEFESKYGIKVNIEAVGAVDAEERLAQDGPAGVGADIFAAPHDHLGSLIAAGLVQPNTNTGEK